MNELINYNGNLLYQRPGDLTVINQWKKRQRKSKEINKFYDTEHPLNH